jgi:HEAT repeat protein
VGKQALDRKLDALAALREARDSPSTAEQLRKALKDRNNYLASKAAALAGEMRLEALVPDLLAAFERFLTDAAKSDPQCWAKNAIARALKDLGHGDAAVFLRGLGHFQLEPVWGGRQDTAATLRATCALALPGCTLGDFETLAALIEALADPAKPVRIDAARAIAQLPRPESALLLRLKALAGDRDPEVTGHVFTALLSVAPRDSVAFVARFLDDAGPDVRAEAAAALAVSHEPAAAEALKRHWERLEDPLERRAVLAFLGSSPAVEAAEFLLSVIAAHSAHAADALAALAAGRYRGRFRERAAAVVAEAGDPRLEKLFGATWPAGD